MNRPDRTPHAFSTALVVLLAALTGPSALLAQPTGPRVLVVTAHPDDEAMFAATMYKVAHHLGGAVDLALVTDGSGGYRFSVLAEPLYGLELTDEAVARQYLPAIRKRELMDGGRIVGIRNYFFLDQPDLAYTTNVDSVLTLQWETGLVEDRLRHIMERGQYDFVFAHLPVENFHGHHKAATILALRVAQRMPAGERPVVLGSFISSETAPAPEFDALPGYPITRIHADAGLFSFSRLEPLGEGGRLNYQIIVNWLIAAHKSQGTMQLLMNRGDTENFWPFAFYTDAEIQTVRDLFGTINSMASIH